MASFPDNTALFTPADWTALAEHGIGSLSQNKRVVINRVSLTDAIVEVMVENPVTTQQQMIDLGYDLDYFIFELCGLENTTRVRSVDPKKYGIPSPYEGLKAIVKGLVNPKFNGNVQRGLADSGLWLTSFSGFYGASSEPDLLFETVVLPALKSRIAAVTKNTTGALTLAARVPGVAALELAAFAQEMKALDVAYQHRYDLAVKELSTADRKALDAILDRNPVQVSDEIAAIEATAPATAATATE